MQRFCSENSIYMNGVGIFGNLDEYNEDFKQTIQERDDKLMVFLHRSPQLKYRLFLVDHIKNICNDKNLSHSCLHLSIYILDIFMDNHSIISERLLLVANVCLLLAAKLEENTSKIPKMEELNSFINNRYIIDDYKIVEIVILKFFNFNLLYPTVPYYVFIYLQRILTADDLLIGNGRTIRQLFYDLYPIIMKYLDKILYDIHYTQLFKPSKLAAGIIMIARHQLNLPYWNQQLEELSGYNMENLGDIINALVG